MEVAIQKIAIICFITLGVSHIVKPRAWADFFILLREKREAGVFMSAFFSLSMGALIVGFHNVWHGIPVLLTIVGWSYLLKSFLYFVFPQYGLRSLQKISTDETRGFLYAGFAFLVLSLLLGVSLLF